MAKQGGKQYGLILPKKQQTKTAIGSVFGNDGDTDEEDGTDWVRKALKAENEKNKVKKQTKLSMQKALKEDPTIYQYDEVYDDIESSRIQSKLVKQEDKRPKYIENLLKAAERRKKEQEHRIERMVQKEREAEGDMYADKESFVTSAYRAKLEEFKKMEEEEARMSRLESIADVTKQQDMSGFYRHLFANTVDKPKLENDKTDTSKPVDSITDSMEIHEHVEKSTQEQITAKTKRNRQYRQRVVNTDNSDSESDNKSVIQNTIVNPELVKNKNYQDHQETVLKEPESKKHKQEHEQKNVPSPTAHSKDTPDVSSPPLVAQEESKGESSTCENNSKDDQNESDAKQKLELARKERSRIWEKRTVNAVFDAALERYYTRKAMRLSAA